MHCPLSCGAGPTTIGSQWTALRSSQFWPLTPGAGLSHKYKYRIPAGQSCRGGRCRRAAHQIVTCYVPFRSRPPPPVHLRSLPRGRTCSGHARRAHAVPSRRCELPWPLTEGAALLGVCLMDGPGGAGAWEFRAQVGQRLRRPSGHACAHCRAWQTAIGQAPSAVGDEPTVASSACGWPTAVPGQTAKFGP